ncbi:thioredoxin-like domain-containing protein [Thalassoglobus polymorphus]|uniref:Thiol-disulfide oxidoreductase YkuV n=1 Tax=Thalassoglobus polymorphus TaxID=2527994 RepID=A0A517QIT8_9PLAN|nr:thioredoxin-like domain-containing protein [Thalassoglobus polymorphus]QDT31559.1 Thiol-disulfide oxidoreductase YkuV [Thalassoglobus polymorphus]
MFQSRGSRPRSKAALFMLLVAAGVLAGNTPMAQAQDDPAPKVETENPFPGRFPAPSIDGGTAWLNCSGPISLEDLRGKIVLLDFWTYCCINCIHVLPDLKFLEQKYPDQLVVIGVHSAKFDNEKESENIREAVVRYEIEHPVVNDANMVIARKYAFNSWPTFVLIDPEGNFVGRQPGEGNRELFDRVIGQMVEYHREKGTLDETPVRFDLEREKEPDRPLKYPGKVLADETGNRLFISDSNHNRIVISSLDGKLIDVIGSGKIGSADGNFETASFDHPHGMELVGETLYVADTENHLIRSVDLKSKTVSTLAGTGSQARVRLQKGKLRETALNSPWDVRALDGVLYIAMAGPHQLWKHKIGSDTVELYAGNGREDIVDGPLAASSLAQPSAIKTDGKSLFVVDSEGSAIREIQDGMVTTIVGPHDLPRGRSLFEFGDIDGVGDQVRLQHPIGVAYHDGMLYVADTYNDKIKQVNIKTRESKSWLGTGERGAGLDPVQMNEPAGLEAANGHLFIADTNNHRILKVNLATKETSVLTVDGLTHPVSTASEPPAELVEGEAEKSSTVTIAAGKEATLTVDFEFTDDYKLNKLAPVAYQLKAVGQQNVVDPSVLGKRKKADSDDVSASVTVPLTGESGEAVLELSIAYQYCRDGVGGVCKFASKKWLIPVKVDPAAKTSDVKLIAKP